MATNQTYMDLVNDHWEVMAPPLFSIQLRPKFEQNKMSSVIRKKYFGEKPLNSQTVKHMFQVSTCLCKPLRKFNTEIVQVNLC